MTFCFCISVRGKQRCFKRVMFSFGHSAGGEQWFRRGPIYNTLPFGCEGSYAAFEESNYACLTFKHTAVSEMRSDRPRLGHETNHVGSSTATLLFHFEQRRLMRTFPFGNNTLQTCLTL